MAKSTVFTDTVHIYDTDAQGIVHYAGYYRFFTDATEKFMREVIGIKYPLLNENIWFVVVESNAVYKKPARLGETLTVTVTPEMLSKKALKFNFEISGIAGAICSGYITQVSIDRRKWHAVEMPAEVVQKLSK
ncbi:acyl-CoA thioesterase [Candidatus Marsarchaeota archaeon]|nr:acyl-CoA thioesterase [Candidatus Marsarchaeota archaeon]MCL5404867.1 acyl-CoA thioesterase [Candidatus Marsarchaeota archaeon]